MRPVIAVAAALVLSACSGGGAAQQEIEAYCEAVSKGASVFEASGDPAADGGEFDALDDPAEIEAYQTGILEYQQGLAENAPAEIADAQREVAAWYELQVDWLRQNDWAPGPLPEDFEPLPMAALQAVADFQLGHCTPPGAGQ